MIPAIENSPGTVLFAADLDGTLIHSHRHWRPGDVVVEMLHGKPQSFMTENAVSLLRELQQYAVFVPITSRSIDQYRRIVWPKGIAPPRLAIVSNGGNVLVDGELSAEWSRASEKMIQPYRAKVEQAYRALMGTGLAASGRVADGMFAAAAFKDNRTAARAYGETVFPDGLWSARSGRKIFAGPPGVDKKTALCRLMKQDERIPPLIAAGDSIMDIGMLQIADLALVPKPMAGALAATRERIREGVQEDFAAAMLKEALGWCQRRARPRACVVL